MNVRRDVSSRCVGYPTVLVDLQPLLYHCVGGWNVCIQSIIINPLKQSPSPSSHYYRSVETEEERRTLPAC